MNAVSHSSIPGPTMNPFNQLNFSGGPGVLPACVLAEIQQAIMEVPGTRLSLLGISTVRTGLPPSSPSWKTMCAACWALEKTTMC